MKKSLLSFMFIAFALSGCSNLSNGNFFKGSSSSKSSTAGKQSSSFTRFSDIPVPSNSNMDLERTLVMGEGNKWIGRLYLSNSYDVDHLFTFYQNNMKKFGWKQVTAIRSSNPVLTYELGKRVATIVISRGRLSLESNVEFTMSSRDLMVRSLDN